MKCGHWVVDKISPTGKVRRIIALPVPLEATAIEAEKSIVQPLSWHIENLRRCTGRMRLRVLCGAEYVLPHGYCYCPECESDIKYDNRLRPLGEFWESLESQAQMILDKIE